MELSRIKSVVILLLGGLLCASSFAPYNFLLGAMVGFIPLLWVEESISKKGENNDTTNLQLETNNNAIVDIFNSYSSSLMFNLTFIFKDRHLECDGNEINIYKTLLKSGSKKKTTGSKLIKKIKIRKSLSSLEKSIDFFLDKVNKNKNFSDSLFNYSIKSNELLFSN